DSRVLAARRLLALGHPVDQIEEQSTSRFRFGVRIRGQHQSRKRWLRHRETPGTATVRSSRVVIPAHVARQAQILVTSGAGGADTAAAIPHFRSAEVLEDLRAGMARSAALQEPRHAAPARLVALTPPP